MYGKGSRRVRTASRLIESLESRYLLTSLPVVTAPGPLGTIAPKVNVTAVGSIGVAGDEAQYSFTVSAKTLLNISLTKLKANADLKLADAAGNTIATSARPQKQAEKIRFGAGPGTYSLVVSSGSGNSTGTAFRLTLSAAATKKPVYNDPQPAPAFVEADDKASPATVSVSGVSADAFNPLSGNLTFSVSGAAVSGTPTLFDNGIPQSGAISVDAAGGTITAPYAFVDGKNDLTFLATDAAGALISFESVFWAGGNDLTVSLNDAQQGDVDGTAVVARLGDNSSVQSMQSVSGGQAVFHNVPNRTIILRATGQGNRFATAAVTGNAGNTSMTLEGFNPPNDVDNNDFSLGLDGWDVGNAPVTLIPHPAPTESTSQPAASAFAVAPLAASTDMDLRLSTSGEGPQSISRTFKVDPGTQQVILRYQFITSEVPGGYFGSKYNDYYSVSIRSLNGGGSVSDSQSMNGLGLAAFDANGATAFREVKLPVGVAGDTVQVDVTVANVADGLYDSQVVVDAVTEQQLQIKSDLEKPDVNRKVTFSTVQPFNGQIVWSVDGVQKSTTNGSDFVAQFTAPGDHTVTAVGTTSGGQTSTDSLTVHVPEPSGGQWVSRFPTSVSTSDLDATFQSSVNNFISALQNAGATVTISATLRPPERAYLMHYAYAVAHDGLDARTVPAMDGVDIGWAHYNSNGDYDPAASRQAAQAMVSAYNIAYAPALSSLHTMGLAIDMNISWSGTLSIVDASGNTVTIDSKPTNGAGNSDLWDVGASYGVNKLPSDAPHWSSTGH